MEIHHSRFVPHGMVVSADNPSRIHTLFRSDEVVRGTSEIILGNERWCLDGPDGMDVMPLDSEQTTFSGVTGEIFILQEIKPANFVVRKVNRIKPSPAPDVCSLHRRSRELVAGGGRRSRPAAARSGRWG